MYEVSINNNLLSVNCQETATTKMYSELKGDLGLCRYFWFCLFYAIKGISVKIFDSESSPNNCI